MTESVSASHSEVHLGAQGRLVIPAELRRRLGFSPGDTLVARSEEDRRIADKAEAVKRRLKERFQRVPKAVDLAAEVIEERRRGSGSPRSVTPGRGNAVCGRRPASFRSAA